MTSLASTSSPPSFGLFRACCRRNEPAPPWLLLSSALVLGLGSHPGTNAFGVLALLLLGLMSWGAGWGAASHAPELAFAGGWITAWSGAATVLLLTPGLLRTDARAWGAGGAAVLGVGLLAMAWRRRSRLIGVEPSANAHPTTGETFWLLLGCAAMLPLLHQLRSNGPDWLVMTTALLLYAALAKRGRVAAQEVEP